jgi:hypothetical protein
MQGEQDMLNELIKLSDVLDRKGMYAESDLLDNLIQKLAVEEPQESSKKEWTITVGGGEYDSRIYVTADFVQKVDEERVNINGAILHFEYSRVTVEEGKQDPYAL